MRTADQWLGDELEAAAWCDAPADVVARIQREAFLAGAIAQRDAAVRLAPAVVALMPSVLVHVGVAVAIARAVEPEQVAAAQFGAPAPVAVDRCERCNGTGDQERRHNDDGEPWLFVCPDCHGSGRA